MVNGNSFSAGLCLSATRSIGRARRFLNRDAREIGRLLTPELWCPHFSHQTANNALIESAKRLVRRDVSPGGTALRRIDAAGFGLRKTLRNLVVDSCLKLSIEFVDRHEIFVQWIPAAPGNPVNPFTKLRNRCKVFRPVVINGDQ